MITLRDITESDLEMLREHRNRVDTRVWLGNADEVSAKEQRAWFSVNKQWNEKGVRICEYTIARDTGDGVDIGLARLTNIASGSACVGADVFARYRGRKLGHDVFAAACARATELGASQLWLKVFIENVAAVRIYKKAGFIIDPNVPVDVYCRSDLAGGGLLHYVTMRRSR